MQLTHNNHRCFLPKDRDEERYYEVTDWDISQALRFREPTPSALADLREVLGQLPVIPFRAGRTPEEGLADAVAIGSLDEIMGRLAGILVEDYESNVREVGEFGEFEVIVSEFSSQPDALHVITRIWAKHEDSGSLLYGAHVQRIEPELFALWSDY